MTTTAPARRPDGRAPNQLRPVKIVADYLKFAEGSVLIRVGDTRVVCAVTIDDRVPGWLRGKGSGWVTAEYSMLPRAGTERSQRESMSGRVGGRTHEIQRLIGRSLRGVVDLSRLGERTITVDCDVIQADGGTRTASITGAYVALARAMNRFGMGKLLTGQVAAVSVGMAGAATLLDLKAARLLGVDPASCLAIEDSDVGARSAEAAGCTVLCVPNHVPIPVTAGRLFAESLAGLTTANLPVPLPTA